MQDVELMRRALEEQKAAGQILLMLAIQAAGGSIVIPDHLVASFDFAQHWIEATKDESGWRYSVRAK